MSAGDNDDDDDDRTDRAWFTVAVQQTSARKFNGLPAPEPARALRPAYRCRYTYLLIHI